MADRWLVRVSIACIALAAGMILGDFWQQPTITLTLQPVIFRNEYLNPKPLSFVIPFLTAPYHGRCKLQGSYWRCPEDSAYLEQ